MPKQIRTRPATSKDGKIALLKAQQFLDEANDAFKKERWDAAGLNSIHSSICGADAMLIFAAGIRCAAQDHSSVVNLLEKYVKGFKGSPRTQLVGLLKMKNDVAYEQRLISQAESQRIVLAANRFMTWVQQHTDSVKK